MDLECIILSEISQTEKDKYHLIPLYVKSKNKTNKRKKTETDSQIDIENKQVVSRGERAGGMSEIGEGD